MQVQRLFNRIMLCAMLLALLTACGGPPPATATEAPATEATTSPVPETLPPATASPEPSSTLKGEISVSLWATVDALEADPTVGGTWGDVYRLIKEWHVAHPDVTINWVSFPEGDARVPTMNTQLLGGTLPDLVGGYSDPGFQFEIAGNTDLFYDLSADLAKPNPYGSETTWKDELVVDPRQFNENVAIPEDKVFFLGNATPTAMAAEVFYYNIDMFEEAGIDSTPKTWAELMATFQTLEDAGITPMFVNGATQLWNMEWNVQLLEDQLNDPVIRQINEAWGKDPNNTPDAEMMTWAITNGVMRADSAASLEIFRLLKEMSQYWNEDWAAPEELDYFLNGRTATYHWGSWDLSRYNKAPERTFRIGAFAFPKVTEESSPEANDNPARRFGKAEGGDLGSSFFIPMTTVERGNLPIALDLLQYLTARPTNDKWCTVQYPPCIAKGQTVADVVSDPEAIQLLNAFFDPLVTPETAGRQLNYPAGAQDARMRLAVEYLQDRLTIEEFGSQVQAEFERLAEQAIVEHPEWDTANWPQP